MKYEQLITEKFINAIGDSQYALDIKHKYKNKVWDMLARSYAKAGGIKGSGFSSPDDMVNIPFWKIGMRDGVPKTIMMYKDKAGRKGVAIGSDGSVEGAALIDDIMRNEIYRSYGEKSKAALGKILKLIPWDIIQQYIHTPEQVSRILAGKNIIPLVTIPNTEWPEDAQVSVSRHPHLLPYGYLREINGTIMFKIMIGTTGNSIK